MTQTISFIRHYDGYTGGHQKVRDYISHFLNLGWHPSLYLINKAATKRDLFENIPNVNYQVDYAPDLCDITFLAGMDWQAYLAKPKQTQPVINLIQHVRHADPKEALFQFLQYPALRICVSDAVRDAIKPHANGPCVTIRMGHDIAEKSKAKSNNVYILGNKRPDWAYRLKDFCSEKALSVRMHDRTVEKHAVLHAMSTSEITVVLPHQTEGFYLPGIEAMALSNLAIIPDCVANKEYCRWYANSLTCENAYDAIEARLSDALKMRKQTILPLRHELGRRIAVSYSLNDEKQTLKNVLKKYASSLQ